MLKLSGAMAGVHPGDSFIRHATQTLDSYQTNRTSNMPSPDNSLNQFKGGLSPTSRITRKQREFIPDENKDDSYWVKRRKNNEAAKRSREKRRVNDMVMSQQIAALQEENSGLKQELLALKKQFGVPVDQRYMDTPQAGTSEAVPVPPPPTSMSQPPSTTSAANVSPRQSPRPALNGMQLPSEGPVETGGGGGNSGGAPKDTQRMPALIPVTMLNPALAMGMAGQGSSAPGLVPGGMRLTTPAKLSFHQQLDSAPTGVLQPTPEMSPHNGLVSGPLSVPYRQHSSEGHGQPGSPCSTSSSPRSLTISFSAASSGEESDRESPRKWPLHPSPNTNSACPPGPPHYLPMGIARSDRIRERKGIPHKLRHKEQFLNWDYEDHNPTSTTSAPATTLPNGFMSCDSSFAQSATSPNPHGHFTSPHENNFTSPHENNFTSPHENNFTSPHENNFTSPHENNFTSPHENNMHANFHLDGEESQSSVDSSDPTKSDRIRDPRYVERRRKNNVAARKCRENRRQLNELRLAKSQYLEAQNSKLKDELKVLTDEVQSLKDWLEKKNQAKAKGEVFAPPHLEPSLTTDTDSVS